MSEAIAWDEGFDACRDGVKRRNPYQPLPAAAVPEAEDGRPHDSECETCGLQATVAHRDGLDFCADCAAALTTTATPLPEGQEGT